MTDSAKYRYFLDQDATDRRVALDAAVEAAKSDRDMDVTTIAAAFYQWLRDRPSLRPARLTLTAAKPMPKG